jgi:hypothetical protein
MSVVTTCYYTIWADEFFFGRYYGRRKGDDSDSELSGDGSDGEAKKRISQKIKERYPVYYVSFYVPQDAM